MPIGHFCPVPGRRFDCWRRPATASTPATSVPAARRPPRRAASTPAYAERDACLARNATERALAGAAVRARAQALALACAAETERLITASSRGDAAVARAIRDEPNSAPWASCSGRQARTERDTREQGRFRRDHGRQDPGGAPGAARTDWDGSDLDHFVQVLCRLDADRHGFGALDLLAVEGAWVGAAGETWSGGFVARLKDGKRAHVDGRAGRSQWSERGFRHRGRAARRQRAASRARRPAWLAGPCVGRRDGATAQRAFEQGAP